MLKSSVNIYESSSSNFFRTTSRMQPDETPLTNQGFSKQIFNQMQKIKP